MLPKISVLVPTYNRSEMLKKAIESILAQSYTDFELIVVDNNSNDDTAEVVNDFADKRIKFFKNNINIGAVNNYNQALRLAQGEYIHLFSDDDVMLPGNLASKAAILNDFPTVGVVHSNIYEIDKNDVVFSPVHWAAKTKQWRRMQGDSFMSGDECYKILYNEFCFISMPSAMVRKSLLDTYHLEFNNQLKYLIDWGMWLKLARVSDFYFIKEPLVSYRHHEKNEAKLVTANRYFQELMEIKLSLLEDKELAGNFVDAIAELTKSVKKQLLLNAPIIRSVTRYFWQFVPANMKGRIKSLLGR